MRGDGDLPKTNIFTVFVNGKPECFLRGDIVKSIKILENDQDMLTVKVGDRVLVYNKEHGYWYDTNMDEIVNVPEALYQEIFSMTKCSDDIIEEYPNYVYHDYD